MPTQRAAGGEHGSVMNMRALEDGFDEGRGPERPQGSGKQE
jgi:hypothetical protein